MRERRDIPSASSSMMITRRSSPFVMRITLII
jgi:hypothetical protein